MSKQKLIGFFFERNYMVPPVLMNKIPESFDFDYFFENNNQIEKASSITVLSEDVFESFNFNNSKVETIIPSNDYIKTSVEVIDTYVDKPKKRKAKDFVLYMKSRYKVIKKILLQRIDLQGTISISKSKLKQEREPVSIIGFVYSIGQTKNGHTMLEIEDPTGIIKVLISAKNEECLELAQELVLDEVIGIVGVQGGPEIIFANNIIFPDIPIQEYKKAQDDVCVAFVSDLHVGSNLFAKDEFERFIDWLNLRHGNEQQKALARKVKYLVISGDLIDGVGIYPGQDKELTIKDIYGQYEALAVYLDSLRDDIKIICCGGNHDALRIAEPQPPLSMDYARSIHAIKNMTLVSNPSTVRIHKMFDILIYHGYCFDHYMNNIDYLRKAGSYEASDVMMEFVLKKRHLAPTHISALYIPDIDRDFRVIERVPDIFVTGHIHYDIKVKSYKNVTLIGCSSFQYKTDFQEKLGHTDIVWGKTAIMNLKTRRTTVMDFRNEEDIKEENR
jgi:DNA polymerase II small subunit